MTLHDLEAAALTRWHALLRRLFGATGPLKYSWKYCPVALPWFALDTRDNVDTIHCLALEWAWRRRAHTKAGRWLLRIQVVAWPLTSFIGAMLYMRQFAPFVSTRHGVGVLTQLGQLLYLANRFNIPGDSYYKFHLWEKERRQKATSYIQHHEIITLLPVLNSTADTAVIDDKARFFEACRAYGIPTANIVVVFDKGNARWYEDTREALPTCDLFCKYTNAVRGSGAERWIYEASSGVRSRNGVSLDDAGLIERCRRRSLERPVIVQRRLSNHAVMEPFSLGALCTLRVVSIKEPEKPARVLVAGLRMPLGSAEVDNFGAGGIAAALDPQSGRLSAAIGRNILLGTLTHHPSTGHAIENAELSGWREMIALALRAHDTFGAPWFVGWDVASTPEGPVLIEGNTTWGVELAQMTTGRPLGETEFPSLLLDAVAAVRRTSPKRSAA